MSPLLEVVSISAGYTHRPAVEDISLEVQSGQTLAVVGPNAAGKSSLLRAVTGALPCLSGEVRVSGQPLPKLTPKQRAHAFALVPQSARFDLDFTVLEMVSFGRAPYAGTWGLASHTDRVAVNEALARADVTSLASRAFSELSGGERQRVLLARALAQAADILLLDEPTAQLDLGHQLLVIDLVKEHAEAGGAAIVVLHDLALATRLDSMAVIEGGRLVALGPPTQVLTPKRLRSTWGVCGRLDNSEDGPVLRLSGRV